MGEKEIAKILKSLNCRFIRQYKDARCKNIGPLPFDFKVEFEKSYALIEYNGRQHYKQTFKNEDLQVIQLRDKIKAEFCRANRIPFLIIKYTEYHQIEAILNDWINDLRRNKY